MNTIHERIKVEKITIFPKIRETVKKAIPKPNWVQYELTCRITDLEWKWYFINRCVELFDRSYLVENSHWEKNDLNSITTTLMDCYLYFEAFLFQSKSFLDLLAQLYPRFISHKQSIPKRSFNKFREWVCEKALAQGFPKEIVDFFNTQTNWFQLLQEYRDMFAHVQGYNPMVGRNKEGRLLLKICTIDSSRQGNPHIREVISAIQNGIENLVKFSDDVLSTYGVENLRRFKNGDHGVISVIDEKTHKRIKIDIAIPLDEQGNLPPQLRKKLNPAEIRKFEAMSLLDFFMFLMEYLKTLGGNVNKDKLEDN